MLEHIAKNNCVETADGAEVDRLYIANNHLTTIRTCNLGHGRVLLNTRYRATKLDHLRTQITCRRADFQHLCGSFLFNPPDDLRVAAIRIGSLINVVIPAHVVLGFVNESCFMQSVPQGSFHTIKRVSHSVDVAYLVTVVGWNWTFDNTQASFLKLNQDVRIEVPFIRIQHEGDFLQRLATVEPIT